MAKKSLGQHFLHAKGPIMQMIKAANLEKGNLVVEVGPGKGVLTKELLATGARVIAIEKDRDLIPLLEETFSKEIQNKQLTLIEGDILTTPLPKEPYVVVANIPYYITGAIIRYFLEADHLPRQLVLLIQKEVADRILARDKKESLLSISVKISSTPKVITKVSRGAFNPPPKVDSAVISLENIHDPFKTTADRDWFFKVLHAGFAHKRKVLARNLEAVVPKEAITPLTLEKKRAEELSVGEWQEIALVLGKSK